MKTEKLIKRLEIAENIVLNLTIENLKDEEVIEKLSDLRCEIEDIFKIIKSRPMKLKLNGTNRKEN